MAKNDNLTDFLTDIADAIRAKKGITGAINPQNFSSEIASIQSGGGSSSGGASKNDVNFYDYDGTLLHSYSASEIASMSQLPELPTREGLTCQGWNYTLDNIKSMVSDYGKCDVGATYITDDGKTRLYIRIATKGRMDVPLYFTQTSANGVTIDWGDGSTTQTLSETGKVSTTHTYSNIGDYCITLKVTSGTLELGHNSSSYCVLGSIGNYGKVYCNMLQKVEIGSSVTIIRSFTFYNCYSLTSVVIPSGVTSIGSSVFSYCYSLASIVIPSGVKYIESSVFTGCRSLASVVIPSGVTNIGYEAFYYCYSLASIVIPSGVTGIGNSVFSTCESLVTVVIPSGVTSIGSRVFDGCYGMAYYDFSNHKSVPTLSNTNAFSSIPSDCKIVVPDSLYDTWIAATNWSIYSSKIVKASAFTF
jgi:hypothetical protein